MAASHLFNTLNYHVVPLVFLVLFTGVVQILVRICNPTTDEFNPAIFVGNVFAWKFLGSVIAWAFLWLWIPGKIFYGPATNFGYVPVYKANGELYYFASLSALGIIVFLNPGICITIYENMGYILGGLNIIAFTLCLYLLVKAKLKKEEKDPYLRSRTYPIGHEFYRGMELHPRLLGVDVKQLTNCRIGLMLWQWLVIIYFCAAYQLHGLNEGHLSSTILQTVYLYKFYHWETGYFNTLDITMDRAGYYICWGCLVWVPTFYTFHSFYFVRHLSEFGPILSGLLTLIGLGSIYYNYEVDRQKELFRTYKGKDLKIWGVKPSFVKVSYKTQDGLTKESQLLTSGWWGVTRKINYTFELMGAYCWCAGAGVQYGYWPFLYAIFLTILLLHRIYRDEDKCKTKYGKGWSDYCKQVPYRLIPYVF